MDLLWLLKNLVSEVLYLCTRYYIIKMQVYKYK